jgi:uncharacterized protein YbaR (Trm112 family)
MRNELREAIISLLQSGEDAGCNGLVCVEEKEYHKLRRLLHDYTGQWYGLTEGIPINFDKDE